MYGRDPEVTLRHVLRAFRFWWRLRIGDFQYWTKPKLYVLLYLYVIPFINVELQFSTSPARPYLRLEVWRKPEAGLLKRLETTEDSWT